MTDIPRNELLDKLAAGWKAHLKGRAQALFPQLTVTLKTADALLILEAGKKLTTSK